MIIGKTQKIMKKGINKYSKHLDLDNEDTQILINSSGDGLTYKMCGKWNPKMKVSFKDIMDVKVDLLGFENLASPFLAKSVEMYANKYETSLDNINLFLFEKNNKIGVAVYFKEVFKETLSLDRQFERLGL